jgi:hypothetical protein
VQSPDLKIESHFLVELGLKTDIITAGLSLPESSSS